MLEHIEQDETALRNIYDLLKPGGQLLLLHPWLYGSLDQHLGHRRRYRMTGLRYMLEATGFRVVYLKYFNRIGILGWVLNSRVLRRKRLSSFQLRIYNLFVPLFKLERFFPFPFGISILAVGEKSE